MVEFTLYYYNKITGLLHSTQTVTIPTIQLVGATQSDITNILISSMKYKSMDCVFQLTNSDDGAILYNSKLHKSTLTVN